MSVDRKNLYIEATLRKALYLIQISDLVAEDVIGQYFDNGYNSGAGDPIADADCTPFDITAAQFANLITFIQQFNNPLTNATVTEADYWSTLNDLRHSVVVDQLKL